MNCKRCDTPLPDKRRRNHVYCSRRCSALDSNDRRKTGEPAPPRWQHPALTAEDPVLRAAAQHAQLLGQAHGWNRSTTRCVIDGLATVLEGRPAGQRVPLSEVRTRPHRWVSRPRLIEVLTDLDLLDDDSTAAIRSWIDCVTTDLAPGFVEPVRHWLTVLLDGDARALPRSTSTVYVYFGCARPFLEQWASRYDHLREVTRTDISAALAPLDGWKRANVTAALRSLFGFAKKRGLIFTNPTVGLKARPADFALLP
ncbi:hypothetical protein [Nocardia terpenica]|uniref:hypothetical protein n=1 Tax=Nocardia terpenica TaxID=455432 RepID=UPI001EEBFCA1|nr:hypothetical protein [Nocardia terpenica]